MGLLRRILNAVITPLVSSALLVLFCYITPRLFLESDFELSSLRGTDFDFFSLELNVFVLMGLIPIILGIITVIGSIWGFISLVQMVKV